MRRTAARLISAVVLIAVIASCAGQSAADNLVRRAHQAAEVGDWPGAFTQYRMALQEDPLHEAADVGVRAAAARLIATVPGLPADTEVELLRWLEGERRWLEVATLLDASVIPIPAGWAMMGTTEGRPDEQPRREVYLDAFAIDRYEVTNLQYAAFATEASEPLPVYWIDGAFPEGTATHPVVGVSWGQADSYCAAAGKRLPTEAEWERACRDFDGLTYPWGTEWDPTRLNTTMHPLAAPDDAWPWLTTPASESPGLVSVGEPETGASPFGVCNLAGNASEWVADWYDSAAYETLGDVNPIGAGPPWNHSIRGGSWLFRHDDAELMVDQGRCAFRNSSHSFDDPRVGFRCASDPE